VATIGGHNANLSAWTNLSLNPGGGNVGIGTSMPVVPLDFADLIGPKISLWGSSTTNYGFGIQAQLLQIHTDSSVADIAFGYGSSANLTETMRVRGNGNVGIGNTNPTNKLMVVNARCDGSSWINASDRNLKEDFEPVDAQAILAKIAALPIQSWSYKAQPEQKHVGPVAPSASARTTQASPPWTPTASPWRRFKG
jgi:hypothetical protein